MLYDFQDPKYQIEVIHVQKPDGEPGATMPVARLVNRASGKPIPADEPVFILRGQDVMAATAIEDYLEQCHDGAKHMVEIVEKRLSEFEAFADKNRDRMKTPD